MKSVVLVDLQRINKLNVMTTFFTENGRFGWNDSECAYKFLVVGDQLVIAPVGDHSELYATYIVWKKPLDEAEIEVDVIAKEQWESRNYAVTAAGKIGVDGKVTGWKSECFRITTPSYMQAEIEQEVFRLFNSGELTL